MHMSCHTFVPSPVPYTCPHALGPFGLIVGFWAHAVLKLKLCAACCIPAQGSYGQTNLLNLHFSHTSVCNEHTCPLLLCISHLQHRHCSCCTPSCPNPYVMLTGTCALQQYWTGQKGWTYVPVVTFAEAFQNHRSGKNAMAGLAQPFDQSKEHKDALVTQKYSLSSKPSVMCLPMNWPAGLGFFAVQRVVSTHTWATCLTGCML